MLCDVVCDEACLEMRCITSKPPAYVKALKRIMMTGTKDEELKAWHPAITSTSPVTSLAVMSYLASNKK